MLCRMEDLRNKEVINVRDGARLGFVCDVEMNTETAALTALVIYGRLRWFGLLGREPDRVIPWKQVGLIGDDTVLVDFEDTPRESRGRLADFLGKIGKNA